MLTKRIATLIIVCCALVFSSCTQPPSNDVIARSIKDYLQDQGRSVSITGAKEKFGKALRLGAQVNVDSVEIKQIGKYNEGEKYWPVKAVVKGTRQADLIVVTGSSQFDEELDFKLRQDEFGEWKAVFLEQ